MGIISKGLGISTFVDPAVQLPVVADFAKVRQVLLNLASNAVKFTDRGGIWINVGAADALDDGRLNIRFEVIDTGLGISEEAQANLFQQYVQADTSITRRYGGSGLGLAICRKLVELIADDVPKVGQLPVQVVNRLTHLVGILGEQSPKPASERFGVVSVLRHQRNDLPCQI